jgi:putative membrane protein
VSTDTAAPPAVEVPWRRLDRRMLVVGPLSGLGRLVPVVAVLLITGGAQGDPVRLWIAVGAAVAVVLAGVLRWQTTRYRITADRVELHSGWLRRQRRSVPRDRIRTVDLTAKLLHRAFGLSVVRVSSAAAAGPDMSGVLHLDAVSKTEAERLRRQLLDRSPPAADQPAEDDPQSQELARLDWAWLRYAPLTFSSLAAMGALAGAVFNLVWDLGIDPREIDAVEDAAGALTAAPLWIGVAVIGLILLAVAVVGALLLFAERWFDYRLTREPDGTLRVRRGLLTRRSLSVSEQRLRGAEIVEPLLLRAGGGAKANAVSTGLTGEPSGGALQPPAPRAHAHRIASAALQVPETEITLASLRRHPRAALTRRLVRAIVPVAVLAAAAFTLGALLHVSWLGPVALALVPIAGALGWDRYRNLGHRLTGGYLVTRSGSVIRRTVALQRTGVIGWTFRQTPFQRRSGLVSVEAVTAAGIGGYPVTDVAAADAVDLADATLPGLLTAFRSTEPAPRR